MHRTRCQFFAAWVPFTVRARRGYDILHTLDKLPGMIDTIVEAVSAGELDEPLKTASDERRSKFRRVKKSRG